MNEKLFTMRDGQGDVVAGLENVTDNNALLWYITYDKALSSLEVDETAHGTGRDKKQYDVTRTR